MDNPSFWQKMFVLTVEEGGYSVDKLFLFVFISGVIIVAFVILLIAYLTEIKTTARIAKENPIISLKELKKYYWLSPNKYWLHSHSVAYGNLYKDAWGEYVGDYKLGINWYEYIRYNLFVKRLKTAKDRKANYELTMYCKKKYAEYLECVQEDINKIREESAREREKAANILKEIKIK